MVGVTDRYVPTPHVLDRRQLLLGLAAGAAAALAGCSFSGQGNTRGALAAGSRYGGFRFAPDHSEPARPLPPIPSPRPGRPVQVSRLPGGTNGMALTIDDGYNAATVSAYVTFCQDTGIPITFNPNGCYAAEWAPHAAVLRPLIAAGQVQIGNHTLHHLNLTRLTGQQVREEIQRNEQWVQDTFGVTSRPWFRPPYGSHTRRTDEIAGELGFTRILLWNGSFGDSEVLSAGTLLKLARRYLRPGVVLLGHANHPTVTRLYGQIVELIRARDLAPQTLDQVFGTSRAIG